MEPTITTEKVDDTSIRVIETPPAPPTPAAVENIYSYDEVIGELASANSEKFNLQSQYDDQMALFKDRSDLIDAKIAKWQKIKDDADTMNLKSQADQ